MATGQNLDVDPVPIKFGGSDADVSVSRFDA